MFVHLRIIFVQLALNIIVLLLLTLLQGIWFDALHWVILPSVVLVLLNTFLPLLILLVDLPLNLPSLAVFSLVANAAALLVFNLLLPAFHVSGLWTTISGTTVVAVANFLMNWLFYRKDIAYTATLR
jgi:uncharacterized membrane protein YvlD (DUF360 family)